MVDFLGQQLYVGDKIVTLSFCRSSAWLTHSVITGFTRAFVKYKTEGGVFQHNRISPKKVVKAPARFQNC